MGCFYSKVQNPTTFSTHCSEGKTPWAFGRTKFWGGSPTFARELLYYPENFCIGLNKFCICPNYPRRLIFIIHRCRILNCAKYRKNSVRWESLLWELSRTEWSFGSVDSFSCILIHTKDESVVGRMCPALRCGVSRFDCVRKLYQLILIYKLF